MLEKQLQMNQGEIHQVLRLLYRMVLIAALQRQSIVVERASQKQEIHFYVIIAMYKDLLNTCLNIFRIFVG
jgi:hypothetical protein